MTAFLALLALAPEAPALYQKHCSACHDFTGEMRVPRREALRRLPSAAILRAIENGAMKVHASPMNAEERQAVADWLGGADAAPAQNRCAETPAWNGGAGWSNWGAGLENTRHQPEPGIPAQDVPRLKLKWAFGYAGATQARAQPAVAGGRVFAGGQDGSVFALDAKTGCEYWTTQVGAQVRSGLVVAQVAGKRVLFFGDSAGFVHALDAATGAPLWKLRADDHPATVVTGTPACHSGRLYVPVSSTEEIRAIDPKYECCTFRGSVLALEAASGKILWRTRLVPGPAKPSGKSKSGKRLLGPSGVAVWAAPAIDVRRGVLYAVTGDNYTEPATALSDAVVALRLSDGRIVWSRQFTKGDAYTLACRAPDKANCPEEEGPDFDFGASAILSGGVLLLGQKSGIVYAVDPGRRGALLWQARAGQGGTLGGVQWGMAADGRRVYAATSDLVAKRVPRPGGDFFDYFLDPKQGGGLTAFDIATGKQAWRAAPAPCGDRSPCSPAQSQAVTSIPGVVFSGSLDGFIRAFSAEDGRVLWQFDTARRFETVNGVEARGGSLDAGGPVAAAGMLFVNSGYALVGGMPGNVLLAFEIGRN
jgi:polyvinyl alcohol dehydrogenase (cytochrome)